MIVVLHLHLAWKSKSCIREFFFLVCFFFLFLDQFISVLSWKIDLVRFLEYFLGVLCQNRLKNKILNLKTSQFYFLTTPSDRDLSL